MLQRTSIWLYMLCMLVFDYVGILNVFFIATDFRIFFFFFLSDSNRSLGQLQGHLYNQISLEEHKDISDVTKKKKSFWGIFASKIYEAFSVDQIKGQPHQKSNFPSLYPLFLNNSLHYMKKKSLCIFKNCVQIQQMEATFPWQLRKCVEVDACLYVQVCACVSAGKVPCSP